MTGTSTNDIRAAFLNYFQDRGHQILPSASLVPQNDPTLLFTNAGMVPFKNIFTGQEERPYKRATTAQKVVRAGGKHNDLDNVGYTARHHTFFEMMGNFSFGDYFKAEVIEFAWKLLTTDGFGLNPEKLLVTVYAEDEEAASLWRKIAGLSDNRIIRIPTSDNFWRMGDTGPCGPCSEIFYDHGPEVAGGPPGSPDEDGDRFVEIWNLVFMQYLETAQGRSNLPRPSIDTGMGLERFAAVMQGKRDNYDTDTLRALIEASAELMHQDADGRFKTSHRVVADHLRSTAFLIADGVLPSREGRGYVLRRIMRRAMRHLHMMGANQPVFYRLLPALISEMGQAYPELERHRALITETMKGEEERFAALLGRGMALLDDEQAKLASGAHLPGDVAFKLYDTFGFPLDLTQDVLRERGHAVDVEGFENAMAEQRQRARAAWAGSGDTAVEGHWFDVRDRLGATEFLGYGTEQASARVEAVFDGADELAEIGPGRDVTIVLNQTPFYAESGGQVGDTGHLVNEAEGVEVEITDTQKQADDLVVHHGRVTKGVLQPGMAVEARIDSKRRQAIRGHHSAAHLLHAALRRELGEHVTQKGSLNAPERLRFDISQPRPLTADELRNVEREVNRLIRANGAVETRLMSRDEAVAEGAMALFGEKYADEVRVVSMKDGATGEEVYSVELCGGTHVNQLGEIGLFRILSESGVAAGVRRIEAVCGAAAEQTVQENEARLAEVAGLLKVGPAELAERVQKLLEERKALNSQLAQLQQKMALEGKAEQVGDVTLHLRNLADMNPKELRPLAEAILRSKGEGIVALVSGAGGKGSVVIAVSPALQERFNAVELVRKAAGLMGGKGGGGRPDMAQAGGPNPAAEAIFAMLRQEAAQQ
ncbi:alanine--tRNA ligase [Formicincola oecophyllae]|uniref:Alanine--tRNA ligase n=1 Tax=Formicincola oecophyllae TaxID=2558361 RepID=A0A4Y6UBB4_9PROT|nr:alanine--tRNA ligase [Formicincola oecophyllae]QDH13868.1 alanine--tRNA ligase [Formicincola oecophyllae]